MPARENRFQPLKVEARMHESGEDHKIAGEAIVYERESEPIPWYGGEFREIVERGALDGVIERSGDIRASFNHNDSMILGRTSANTLELRMTDDGLSYEITPPKTSYASDLIESINRGDVRGSSIAFEVEDESWNPDYTIRRIKKFSRLHELGPVTTPAFTDTTAALRSLELRMKGQAENKDQDLRSLIESRVPEGSSFEQFCKDIALRSKIPTDQLDQILKGNISNRTITELRQAASALGVSVDQIIEKANTEGFDEKRINELREEFMTLITEQKRSMDFMQERIKLLEM
jgi:uncharacterized protein